MNVGCIDGRYVLPCNQVAQGRTDALIWLSKIGGASINQGSSPGRLRVAAIAKAILLGLESAEVDQI